MPSNYYEKEIAGFVLAKKKEAAGGRKTRRKGTTLSSKYPFDYNNDGEEKTCKKFTHGHYIHPDDGRVYLRQDEGDDKLTLVNDSCLDHGLAKATLLRWLASPEGASVLQKIKNNPPSSQKKKIKLSSAIKNGLSVLFDVGPQFIEDGDWKIESFCRTALAYASVIGSGGGRQTLQNQQLVIARHDEILNTVLQQRWVSQQEMEGCMRQMYERADRLDKQLVVVLQQLNDLGDIVRDHERRLDEHDNRLEQHEQQHAQQQNINRETKVVIQELQRQLSQASIGTQARDEVAAEQEANGADKDIFVEFDVLAAVLDLQQQQAFHAAFEVEEESLVVKPHVSGKDFQTLAPGVWLNDTIINQFMVLLKNQCDSFGSNCHFYSSFFIHKLRDGCKGRAINYDNVKRWSNKVKDGNIFGLDFLFVPINKNNVHWALLVVDMKNTEIKAYDSLRSSCRTELHTLMRYLKTEHLEKKRGVLSANWTLTDSIDNNTPTQGNAYDCGVFVCMYAFYLSMGRDLTFNQGTIDGDGTHATSGRAKIGCSILERKIIG